MTQVSDGLLFLVGFQNHRSQAEAEGDSRDDAKQRDPHGGASSFARVTRAGSLDRSNAPSWFRFLALPEPDVAIS
jgi:hypothetical protein